MKVTLKLVLPLGITFAAGSVFAVDFGTTAFIDGASYVVGGAGSPVQRIGDAITFSLPNANAIGAPKTIILEYTVQASSVHLLPGLLANTTQVATGQATGASSAIFTTAYTVGARTESTSQTNLTAGEFHPYQYAFQSPNPLVHNVRTTLSLIPVSGIVSASAFTAQYSQVPEPMTLGAIAIGLVGLARRKRK